MPDQEPRIIYRNGFGKVPAREELQNAPTASEIEALVNIFAIMGQEWQEVIDDLQAQVDERLPKKE